jgi:hypothetical protein
MGVEAISVKAPVAPPSDTDEIDRHLTVLSDMMKVVSPDKRNTYIRKIDKLLDKRNKLTNA